ncbi:MAG: YceI family protein [Saprospiraceae bacterium]
MQINTSNSTVSFTIKKLFFLTVTGTFPTVKGNVELNTSDLSNAKIDLEIPIAGLSTKNAKRDEHLLQEDFFNAEKFPVITFKSTEITKKGELYWAKGALSMAGTTKIVEIPFDFNNNRATGSLNISRLDFKVGKIPTFVAAENVAITFDCSLK